MNSQTENLEEEDKELIAELKSLKISYTPLVTELVPVTPDEAISYTEKQKIRHKKQLEILEKAYILYCKKNINNEDAVSKLSFWYTHKFNEYLIKTNSITYLGPMAGVKFPTLECSKKVMLVFFAPSNETCVGDENNKLDWNPFLHTNGNYVISFQHLANVVKIDYEKYIMIDMFPHLIWDEGMDLSFEDYQIAITWLSNQIKIIKPSHVYIANKTHGKKILRSLEERIQACRPKMKVKLVHHPGYSNRRPDLVTQSWSEVVKF